MPISWDWLARASVSYCTRLPVRAPGATSCAAQSAPKYRITHNLFPINPRQVCHLRSIFTRAGALSSWARLHRIGDVSVCVCAALIFLRWGADVRPCVLGCPAVGRRERHLEKSRRLRAVEAHGSHERGKPRFVVAVNDRSGYGILSAGLRF